VSLYPLALKLTGRRVLVVGGGAVASRRVPALIAAGAEVAIVSPELSPALHAIVSAGRATWREGRFQPDDVDDAWLVQVAVDDPAAAALVSEVAEQRRVFCVRADDRDAATAWTPAVTRQGPVTVAVTDGGDRRRALAVRDMVAQALETAPPASPEYKGVALVGAGPGDPELITVKGRRLLAAADVVVADRLVPGILLGELRPDVEFVDAAKIPYGPSVAQEEINRILVERALEGKFVVRLKGGDPFVFGRGGEEMVACAEAGVPVVVVPGVTSSIAAPALAGIPVTHRGVAREFTVVSGNVSPDSPSSSVDWSALAGLRGTLVVLMGVKNLPVIAARLID
jgi:uroporphyrin-III C-methyltransferase / precorrin-2 dehydrogenase / sirohydrochlorin ferrochelatase